jgi:large subunit ribosomal protein L35Ae
MKGTIVNFRSSRHHQYDNQMIINVEGIDTKEKAASLVGKKVVYKTESKKEINGKITFTHGNSGAVRAIFETGMPGQSLSKKVDLL